MTIKLYFVAAEPSGDALGADVIDAIGKLNDNVEYAGVGGSSMDKRGVESLFDITDLAIMGLVEGLRAYKLVKQRVEETARDIIERNPDAIVLIDSWGFMWRVGRRVAELGGKMPRIKLVGPQVWATRPGRAKTLSENVDHLLCIHSFEEKFYEPYGLPTTTIGNPALSRDLQGDGEALKQRIGVSNGKKTIGLLLGSRNAEIQRVAPVLEQAAERLCRGHSDRHVICVAADAQKAAIIDRSKSWEFPFSLITEDADKNDAFASFDIALTCSGTVTTEVAMQGAPVVVGYKIGWITWGIARAFLMKSKFITLLNVAADQQIAPEFVQTRFSVENLSLAAERLLTDESARQSQIDAQFAALDVMGRGGRPAADIAAEKILQLATSSQH